MFCEITVQKLDSEFTEVALACILWLSGCLTDLLVLLFVEYWKLRKVFGH